MNATERRRQFAEATLAFIDEWRANPTPTRRQWRAMLETYAGRANVEALLNYGSARGWYASSRD